MQDFKVAIFICGRLGDSSEIFLLTASLLRESYIDFGHMAWFALTLGRDISPHLFTLGSLMRFSLASHLLADQLWWRLLKSSYAVGLCSRVSAIVLTSGPESPLAPAGEEAGGAASSPQESSLNRAPFPFPSRLFLVADHWGLWLLATQCCCNHDHIPGETKRETLPFKELGVLEREGAPWCLIPSLNPFPLAAPPSLSSFISTHRALRGLGMLSALPASASWAAQ